MAKPLVTKRKKHFDKRVGRPSLDDSPLADEFKDYIEWKIMFGEGMAKEKFVNSKAISKYRLENAMESKPYQDYESLYTEIWKRGIFEGSAGLVKQAQAEAIKSLKGRFDEKRSKGDPEYVIGSELMIEIVKFLSGLTLIQPTQKQHLPNTLEYGGDSDTRLLSDINNNGEGEAEEDSIDDFDDFEGADDEEESG